MAQQLFSDSPNLGHTPAPAQSICFAGRLLFCPFRLAFARLFTWIPACQRLITGHRGMRSIGPLKLTPLLLPPRIGAWYLRRKANRQQHGKRWRSFAALIGDRFTASYGDRVLDQRRRRISPRVSLRGCWSGGTSKLSGRKRDVCVLICLHR